MTLAHYCGFTVQWFPFPQYMTAQYSHCPSASSQVVWIGGGVCKSDQSSPKSSSPVWISVPHLQPQSSVAQAHAGTQTLICWQSVNMIPLLKILQYSIALSKLRY